MSHFDSSDSDDEGGGRHIPNFSHHTEYYQVESDEPRLCRLVRLGTVQALQETVQQMSSHDAEYEFSRGGMGGLTALHLAAKLGREDMVKVLVGKSKLDDTDNIRRTPLFYAMDADKSSLAITELLLSHGASAIHRDKGGMTPAILGALQEKPKLDVIKKFLEVDKLSLHVAVATCRSTETAHDKSVIVVRVLLECGADITARSPKKETAMHIATKQGCLAALEVLEFHKRDKVEEAETAEGERPIHIAVLEEWPELVQYLLDQDVSNNEARQIRGWTPLHLAACNGNAAILSILVGSKKAKSSLLHRTYFSKFSPVEIACSYGRDGAAMSLLGLMTEGEIFSKQNSLQEPLLSIAADGGCTRVVHRLVEIAKKNGQLPSLLAEISPANGMTAAGLALAGNQPHIAKILMECGSPMTGISSNGNTALHWAATHGMEELTLHLLDTQSEMEIILNKAGETALDCAAKCLHSNLVGLFLKRQAPARKLPTCTSGWTSLHWATWYHRLDLVRSMVIAGADIKAKDAMDRTAADLLKNISSDLTAIELVEWLTPPAVYDVEIPSHPPPRPKAAAGVQEVCRDIPACIVGVYSGESQRVIEKTRFSVHNAVYDHGPQKIITAVARAQRIVDNLACIWLHLPANNEIWFKDVIQRIHLDRIPEAAISLSRHEDVDGQPSATRNVRFQDPPSKNGVGESFHNNPVQIGTSLGRLTERTMGIDRLRGREREFSSLGYTGPPEQNDLHGVRDSEENDSESIGDQPMPNEDLRSKLSSLHQLQGQFDRIFSDYGGSRPYCYLNPFFKALDYGADTRRHRRYSYEDPVDRANTLALAIPYLSFLPLGHIEELDREATSSSHSWTKRLKDCYSQENQDTLHVPLTLDEYYYHSLLPGRNVRDKDQVLFRHQKRLKSPIPDDQKLLCVVDQLWVYVVDNNTIITSCSRYGPSENLDLQNTIRDHLARDGGKRPPILSACSMVLPIVDVCSRTTEWELGLDKQNLLQVFRTAVARANMEEAELFDKFIADLGKQTTDLSSSERLKSGEILQESELLKEIKDVLDELNIMSTVILAQQDVLSKAFKFLDGVSGRRNSQRNRMDQSTEEKNLSDMISFYQTTGKFESLKKEVDKLVYDATKTQHNLLALLDLRQKAANLSEAIWARQASEDTTKQGRTIMMFTVVTIIFLPITFLTSLFALDITTFPHDDEGNLKYEPGWAFPMIFGVTIAVSVPLIVLALSVNHVRGFMSRLSPSKSQKIKTLEIPGLGKALRRRNMRHHQEQV